MKLYDVKLFDVMTQRLEHLSEKSEDEVSDQTRGFWAAGLVHGVLQIMTEVVNTECQHRLENGFLSDDITAFHHRAQEVFKILDALERTDDWNYVLSVSEQATKLAEMTPLESSMSLNDETSELWDASMQLNQQILAFCEIYMSNDSIHTQEGSE